MKDNEVNNEIVEEETKSEESKKKKNSVWKKCIVIGIIIVVFILILSLLQINRENRITINTKSSLEKIIEINKLSTIEYTYNAIVTKYKDDEVKDGNVEYYVSYKGKVTAGIDFNEVGIDVDYKFKKIFIKLPEVEMHDTSVDMGTLDYILEKNVSEKDSISQEAYKLCKKDLKERAAKETELINNAKENAKSAIEALIKPWVESVDKDFQIEFK